MIAIFRIACCGREVIHGRHRGDDMYPPTMPKCPFGCPVKLLPNSVTEKRPHGIIDRPKLLFLRYEDQTKLTPELRATSPRLEIESGNFWHKYHAAWMEAKSKSTTEARRHGGML